MWLISYLGPPGEYLYLSPKNTLRVGRRSRPTCSRFSLSLCIDVGCFLYYMTFGSIYQHEKYAGMWQWFVCNSASSQKSINIEKREHFSKCSDLDPNVSKHMLPAKALPSQALPRMGGMWSQNFTVLYMADCCLRQDVRKLVFGIFLHNLYFIA